jgi:hypothetical protein
LRHEEELLSLAANIDDAYLRVFVPIKIAAGMPHATDLSLWLDLSVLFRTAMALSVGRWMTINNPLDALLRREISRYNDERPDLQEKLVTDSWAELPAEIRDEILEPLNDVSPKSKTRTKSMEVLSTADKSAWDHLLREMDGYDFYHTSEYHMIEELRLGGEALMFSYRDGDRAAAWPFIVRQVDAVQGLESFGSTYGDATSVYGYPGPLVNTAARETPAFLEEFLRGVVDAARQMRIVCMFSRMNPVLDNASIVGDRVGEMVLRGPTLYVDLAQSEEEQVANYHRNHRSHLRRALQHGVTGILDAEWKYYPDFVQMYLETMERVNAQKQYIFDREYFQRLRVHFKSNEFLFVALKDNQPISAGVFLKTGNIIQYHFQASNQVGLKENGAIVVFDAARQWGITAGAKYLHLGGGVGAKEDNLFRYKSGLASNRLDFCTWSAIPLPGVYEQMNEARERWASSQGLVLSDETYFPHYRTELVVASGQQPLDLQAE